MNIIEAMKERHSVRSFDGKGISENAIQSLKEAAERSTSPFGGNVTVRLEKFDMKEGYRPSTYGMIRGAEYFFLIGMDDDEASALTAGFRFEQVVLRAWQLGLGCCWIAATFKGSDFDRGSRWPDGEELKIICPVGVASRPSLMDKLARTALGSKRRKPLDKIAFCGDFNHSPAADNRYYEALQMLRLAPSSTNSQPWRALVDGDDVHFYYRPQSSLSIVDCGIGICHFYETERFYGRSGEFRKADDIPAAPAGLKYLVTYRSTPIDK